MLLTDRETKNAKYNIPLLAEVTRRHLEQHIPVKGSLSNTSTDQYE